MDQSRMIARWEPVSPEFDFITRCAGHSFTVTRMSFPIYRRAWYYLKCTTNIIVSMISTIEVAILSKVNELSSRFGLKLLESCASYHSEGGKEIITFAGLPPNPDAAERFDRMLTALGSDDESYEIVADDLNQLDAILDRALHLAPRKRQI